MCIATLGGDVSFPSGRDWMDTEINTQFFSPGVERTLFPSPSYHVTGFWPKGRGQTTGNLLLGPVRIISALSSPW